MALSGFRHFLLVVSLCTPKTGGGKGGFWRPSGAGGPPWDWRLTWGCGVQRFPGTYPLGGQAKINHVSPSVRGIEEDAAPLLPSIRFNLSGTHVFLRVRDPGCRRDNCTLLHIL